jgi:hypothetical protein
MKTLRQLSVASVFLFALTMPTFAGQIETGIAPPPPPVQAATTEGQIETGVTTTGQIETGYGEATDSITQAALSVIQSALSLF